MNKTKQIHLFQLQQSNVINSLIGSIGNAMEGPSFLKELLRCHYPSSF